jgi:hypothetical protein
VGGCVVQVYQVYKYRSSSFEHTLEQKKQLRQEKEREDGEIYALCWDLLLVYFDE